MTRIEEIRERLDKARPGPWRAKSEQRVVYVFAGDERLAGVGMAYDEKAVANADLIANAPADLAWCLDKLDAIRALHQPFEWSFGEGPVQSCTECARLGASEEEASYPCPTIRALNDTKEN